MLVSNLDFAAFSSVIQITDITILKNRNKLSHIYQSPILLVITSSLENLDELLTNMKTDSALWDVKGPAIILNGNSTGTNDCSTAEEFLFTAWKLKLLGVIYLCIDADEGLKIFAYNPYTSDAPKFWKISEIFPGFYDHPWTLFEQSYKIVNNTEKKLVDISNCRSLIFNQTDNLGRYPVVAAFYIAETPNCYSYETKDGMKLSGFNVHANIVALEKINASYILLNLNWTTISGILFTDEFENHHFCGILSSILHLPQRELTLRQS